MEEYTRINEKIKELGVKKKWLAKKVNRTEQAISLITNGKTTPSIPLLYAIAKALRVSVCDLLVDANLKWESDEDDQQFRTY